MSDVLQALNDDMLGAVSTLQRCSRELWDLSRDKKKMSEDTRMLCRTESMGLSQYAAVTRIASAFLTRSHHQRYINDQDIINRRHFAEPVIERTCPFYDIVIKPLQFRRKIKAGLGQVIAAAKDDLFDPQTNKSYLPPDSLNAVVAAYYLMDYAYKGSVGHMLKRTEECALYDASYAIQKDLMDDNLSDITRCILRNEFVVPQNYYENNRFTSYPEMYSTKKKSLAINTRIWARSQFIRPVTQSAKAECKN